MAGTRYVGVVFEVDDNVDNDTLKHELEQALMRGDTKSLALLRPYILDVVQVEDASEPR